MPLISPARMPMSSTRAAQADQRRPIHDPHAGILGRKDLGHLGIT
jgi:hypothetical protein